MTGNRKIYQLSISVAAGIVYCLTVVFFVPAGEGSDDYPNAIFQATQQNSTIAPKLPDLGPFKAIEGKRLNFSFKVSDPDPDAELVYSAKHLPKGASSSSNGDFHWLPAYGDQGTYRPWFKVCDTSRFPPRCDAKRFRIDVGRNECRAPVIDPIDDFESVIGETIAFQVNASDLDTDESRLEYLFMPVGNIGLSAFNRQTRFFSWTPEFIYDEVGTQYLQFLVCDDCPSGPLCDEETVAVKIVITPDYLIGDWINADWLSDSMFHSLTISPVGASKRWLSIRLYGEGPSGDGEIAKGYIRFDGDSRIRTSLYEQWGKIDLNLHLDNQGELSVSGEIHVDYKDDGKDDERHFFEGHRAEPFHEP